jgi:hypothetical protein
MNGTTKIDKTYNQIKNEERRLKLIAETTLASLSICLILLYN